MTKSDEPGRWYVRPGDDFRAIRMTAANGEHCSVSEWLSHLEGLHSKAIDIGLDRVRAVHAALGIHLSCPVITVTGTNGKGSTCAMLEGILREAGYRVGLYTSPHLLRYNERVRIDGISITDGELCDSFHAVEQARTSARTSNGQPTTLTYFEFGTVAALRKFSKAGLDVVILEGGLGGRLDAVNIIDADVAIVTTIDIDHTEYLGSSREDIGREKAGIFRRGRVAVCGEANPPASMMAVAAETGAMLTRIGYEYGYRMDHDRWHYQSRSRTLGNLQLPAMRGRHQIANAATALAALDALQPALAISEDAIRRGLSSVQLSGRFQRLRESPRVIIDVAHNPHAARSLAATLAEDHSAGRTHAVFGCMADKDIAGIFTEMKDSIDEWHLASLPGIRGASSDRLQTIALSCGIDLKAVRAYQKPESAYLQARSEASRTSTIVVFGSFLTVAAVVSIEQPRRDPSRAERTATSNVETFPHRVRKAEAGLPI
jgi:dihydrofolate synthase/folylpolyglutamate synthase